MATDATIGWAAGLFEGEGTVRVGSGRQRQPVVSLVSTDEDVVALFARIVACGTVHGYHRPPHKRYWRWCASGADDVLATLDLIEPFLGARRSVAAATVRARAEEIVANRNRCKRGHSFNDPTNVYVHAKTGKRHCRRCRIEHGERRRVSRRAA